MRGFSTREVSEALGFPTSTILAWARSGLVTPLRGPRGSYVFSFQDLAVLRAARELLDAELPARRVREALERLREEMPAGKPLSAVGLEAAGRQVLVRDHGTVWEAATGQFRMELDAPRAASADETPDVPRESGEGGVIAFHIGPSAPSGQEPASAEEWYDRAVETEASDPRAAEEAYRRALAMDAELSDAHLNLGRLRHEAGAVREAADRYRAALDADPTSARAHYNLGVALEDLGGEDDAARAYRAAIDHDPDLAVAHFNLSRLLEARGASAEALRHLAAYKRLLERDAG